VTRVLALALTAALAVPCVAAGQATPKAPSGKYKVVFHGTGSLRVKDKKLTSLSIVPKDDDTACGTSTIKLKVVHTLTTVTRAGYTNWIVGKPTPKKTDAYQLVKTKIGIAGKTINAKIKVLWYDDNIKSGTGEIVFGDCDLQFNFAK
jgi:hypothetical protein